MQFPTYTYASWREAYEAILGGELGTMNGAGEVVAKRLEAAKTAQPMTFLGALQAIRDVFAEHPDVYLLNEGANALDLTRNTIPMATGDDDGAPGVDRRPVDEGNRRVQRKLQHVG